MRSNPFICGAVEGFYGRPWSSEQRRRLFSWMEAWGLNTYLYAPKDDLKHRASWRERYSESEAAELKALIDDCRSKDIRFIYAIAPGLDLGFAKPDGVAALLAKVGQLIDLGCVHFALLFDDIPLLTPGGPGGELRSTSDDQIHVANTLFERQAERTENATLLFCPTHYCGRMAGSVQDSAYLRQLGAKLAPDIQVLWTGPEIVSETISVESIRELASVLQRKPIIWDNLHANDYDMRRIYLGPYSGRSLELRAEVKGVLSNPNCEFELNFVPLRTLATWAQAEGEWNPREAYLRALREWLPGWETYPENLEHEIIEGFSKTVGKFSARQLEFLADCFYLPFELGQRAQELVSDLCYLLRTSPSNWGAAHERFADLCIALTLIGAKITELQNRDLLYAMYRHVWELKEEIRLLSSYVEWLRSKPTLGESFVSPSHLPKVYRGGLVAELQRLLPMDESGGFSHRPSLIPKNDPNPYR